MINILKSLEKNDYKLIRIIELYFNCNLHIHMIYRNRTIIIMKLVTSFVRLSFNSSRLCVYKIYFNNKSIFKKTTAQNTNNNSLLVHDSNNTIKECHISFYSSDISNMQSSYARKCVIHILITWNFICDWTDHVKIVDLDTQKSYIIFSYFYLHIQVCQKW